MPRKEYQPLPILIRGRNKKKPLVTNPNLMTTPVDLSLFFYLDKINYYEKNTYYLIK